MTGALVADRLPGLDEIPAVTAPVWGIDPSTKRISVGLVLPEHQVRVHTLSLPTGNLAYRLAGMHSALMDWLPRLTRHYGMPAAVLVEEPMGASMSRVHPNSQRAVGVLLAALGGTLACPIDLCVPGTWKANSVGHGRASKEDVARWAVTTCGYTGTLQDEMDALGIAWCVALRTSTGKQ